MFMQRRLPSPGFQVEVVILDHDAPIPVKKMTEGAAGQFGTTRSEAPAPSTSHEQTTSQEATGSTSIAPISEASIFTGMVTPF
jgi:phosphatidylinositol-3,4,5-trisphosphate 3-phosphatase/dual-specificity protein phosphatase PTEN